MLRVIIRSLSGPRGAETLIAEHMSTLRSALLATGLTLALAGCATLPGAVKNAPGAAPAPLGGGIVAAPATKVDSATVMVESAAAMLGQPYRFGGTAPGGFDCSGLVAFAAQSAGIRLPRTAQEQLRAGAPVERHEVHAGDLIFMRLARKELHVGIAIDGERFIHAPSTGGRVRIDSLTAPPYTGSFLGARRLVDGRDRPARTSAN
jgi:cell wall-associated NlpC family hydrolase